MSIQSIIDFANSKPVFEVITAKFENSLSDEREIDFFVLDVKGATTFLQLVSLQKGHSDNLVPAIVFVSGNGFDPTPQTPHQWGGILDRLESRGAQVTYINWDDKLADIPTKTAQLKEEIEFRRRASRIGETAERKEF